MNSQIIELSSFNSKEKNDDNSQYTNNFTPITVNSGDIISMKSAFIDTNQTNNYGNINIDNDTDLTLEFGFYANYIAEFGVEPYNVSDGSEAPAYIPNGEPHIARDKTNTDNLISSEKNNNNKGR